MSFLQMSNIFLNQNCLEGMQALPDSSIDLVFADLPYGTTQNSWDTIIPFTLLWEQLNRVCKLTAPMVFTTMQPFSSLLVASNIKNFKYILIVVFSMVLIIFVLCSVIKYENVKNE